MTAPATPPTGDARPEWQPMREDKPLWPSSVALLHILAQYAWHDEAVIVGNRIGLTLLRDAINAALANPKTTCEASVMCSDGEGYPVRVRCEDEREMDLMPFGYTDETAAGGSDLVSPAWMSEPARVKFVSIRAKEEP